MKYITITKGGLKVAFSTEDASYIVKDCVTSDFLLDPGSIKLPKFYRELCAGARVPFEAYEKLFKQSMELYLDNALRLQEYVKAGGNDIFDVEYGEDGRLYIRNDNMVFKPAIGMKWPPKVLEYNKAMLLYARKHWLSNDVDEGLDAYRDVVEPSLRY